MEEELGSGEFMFSPEFLVEELLMDEEGSSDGPGSHDSAVVKDGAALNQILLPRNRDKTEQSSINPWGRKTVMNKKTFKEGTRYSGPLGLSSSAWPPLQQQQEKQQAVKHHQPDPGSGMRAVFLGSSATQKETIGTGVFLPRRFDSRPDCFTVLIPGKVAEALNLTLEESTGFVRRSQTDHSAMRRIRMTTDQNSIIPSDQQACLPPDWTY